jgi:hypothetical protein
MSARQSWPKRTLLAVSAVLIALWSSMLIPGYALGAPPPGGGNNGSVQINGEDFKNGNDPHISCPITFKWAGFDPAPQVDTYTITFTGINPTDGTIVTAEGNNQLHGQFPGPDFTSPPQSLTITGGSPNNKGEYHVSILVETKLAANTDTKSKTVWLGGCGPQNVTLSGQCNTNTTFYDWTVSTSPAVTGVAGTYTPQNGTASNWTTGNTGTATFSTGHVNSIGYTVTTAGWTASTPSPVTATQNNACNAPAGPDVGITKDGTGAAFVGDPVTYTVITTVVNGPTSGTTSVTDTLPNGLTSGSMAYTSGAGTWNCPGLTCSTTSVLATGNTTTFTVNATASAAGNQMDSVHVTAVGDTNSLNDTATKTTAVTAPGSLTLQAACSSTTPGQIAWTVTNPGSNPTVNTLAVSGGPTPNPTTLAPGGTATFTTSAPQNTALTVTGKTTPGNQNVSSNSQTFNGSCTNPGTPETPASVALSSTCTGIHAVFTSADQHTTTFTVTAPHNVSDTVNGSGTRDYNADKNDGHLSVSYDGKSQTYDWVDPGNCSTPPPPPGQAQPGATATDACITGITVVLSNMNGTAPATFTVTAPDGTTTTVPVNAGQLKKLDFSVAEDSTGVVTVSAPGLAKTFTYAKNCTKVLGEKHTVKPPKTPTKVLGEKSQLPFTGFNAKSALFDAASLMAFGAIVCGLALPRRRRFAPYVEG